jgi:hypothetical protein
MFRKSPQGIHFRMDGPYSVRLEMSNAIHVTELISSRLYNFAIFKNSRTVFKGMFAARRLTNCQTNSCTLASHYYIEF